MITLASNVTWGSAPTNYFNFSYEYKRSGVAMQYKVTVSCRALTGQSFFGYPIYLSIELDGTEMVSGYRFKASSPSQWSSAITYTSDWMTVSNKTSGETALSIRLYSGSGSSRDTTYSYSLYVVPAASDLTVGIAEMGTPQTLKITRYDTGYVHTITYRCGNASGTIATKTAATSVSWTPPLSLASQAPSSTAISATLTLQTYSGNTLLGSVSKTITVMVPATVVPTVSAELVPVNPKWGKYVQGISSVGINLTASGVYGSAIASYQIIGGGYKGLTSSCVTGVLYQTGTYSFTCTVIDSRGRGKSITTDPITVYPYSPPKITESNVTRSDGSGVADTNGTYITVLADATYSSVDGSNSVTLKAYCREKGGSGWNNETTLTPGEPTVIGGGAIEINKQYEVLIQAIDGYYGVDVDPVELIVPVGTAEYVTAWGRDRAGIGQYPEEPGAWIGFDLHVNGRIYATKGDRVAHHAKGMLPTVFSNAELTELQGVEYAAVDGDILIAPDANAIYRYHEYSGAVARVYCYQPRKGGITVTKDGMYAGEIMGNFTRYSQNTAPVTGSNHALSEIGSSNFENKDNSLFRNSPFALVASFSMDDPWESPNAIMDYINDHIDDFPLVQSNGGDINDMIIIIRLYAELPSNSSTYVRSNFVDNGAAVFRGSSKKWEYWAADCWYEVGGTSYVDGSNYSENGNPETWTIYYAEQGGGTGFNLEICQSGAGHNLASYAKDSAGGEWVYEAPISDTYWCTAVEASSDAVQTVSGNNSLSYEILDLYAKPGDYHIRTPASILSLGNLQVWRCKYARYGQDKQVWEKLF